ncbi:hypothetical protein [Gemmiger sp.]|uniref:hypothetical protein n=1 Tax=Gemmiger sp. TaxID=2049027 RepID=UPI003AB69538
MKIIEAIQEAYGPEFTTLEDAINWWSGPRAWREDFTAVLILRSGKRPYSVSKKWKTVITTIILLVYVVAIKQNAGINLSIRCYGTGALAYIFYYVIAFTGAILWTILFSKLPVNKGLQFIGKHGVTYMCLQLFTLSVSHKVFSKLISNPVILGWIGIGVTLVGVGIVIEMYDRLRMLMKMKCNSNGLLRP